jgi:hypothetical protein
MQRKATEYSKENHSGGLQQQKSALKCYIKKKFKRYLIKQQTKMFYQSNKLFYIKKKTKHHEGV